MRYDYRCAKCDFVDEYIHGMSETPEIVCPNCIEKMEKIFTVTNFFIKGGTEATHWKEKRIRMKKRDTLGVKQVERYGTGPKLQPNVGGVETDTWSDAAKLAKEAGMSSESYTPLIEKEKDSKKSGIDTVWKKAKEDLK
jgi:putative FmdB family regulatory protein